MNSVLDLHFSSNFVKKEISAEDFFTKTDINYVVLITNITSNRKNRLLGLTCILFCYSKLPA